MVACSSGTKAEPLNMPVETVTNFPGASAEE